MPSAPRTLTTRQGQSFVTTLTDSEAIAVLQRMVDAGTASTFAQSLVGQCRLRTLSEGQWVWVHKIAMEQVTPATAPAAASPDIDLSAVVTMLVRAQTHLRFPRIVFNGLRFAIAGARSRNPGSVNVTNDARRFEDRVWFGRVDTDGRFHPGRQCTPEVIATLRDLATDPVGRTAAEGQRVGSCCFCGRELTTRESLAVGYGPVCAAHYGLPWGGVETPGDEPAAPHHAARYAAAMAEPEDAEGAE